MTYEKITKISGSNVRFAAWTDESGEICFSCHPENRENHFPLILNMMILDKAADWYVENQKIQLTESTLRRFVFYLWAFLVREEYNGNLTYNTFNGKWLYRC